MFDNSKVAQSRWFLFTNYHVMVFSDVSPTMDEKINVFRYNVPVVNMGNKKKKKQNLVSKKVETKPFRKTRGYRFLVITLAFVMLGLAAFSWIVSANGVNWFTWVMLAVFVVAYISSLFAVEILILRSQGKLNATAFKEGWHRFWTDLGAWFRT